MTRVAPVIRQLLLTTELTKKEIATRVGCSTSVVTYHAQRLGLSIRTQRSPRKIRPKPCLRCGELFKPRRSREGTYCSRRCAGQYKRVELQELKNPSSVRRRLLEERPHRCEICARRTWCGVPIPLEVDHIDGRHDNNAPDNVRLVCPNCHALTPTFKVRNKGQGRWRRRQRYRDGKSY